MSKNRPVGYTRSLSPPDYPDNKFEANLHANCGRLCGEIAPSFSFSPISHPPTPTIGQLTTAVFARTVIHILAKVTHLHLTGREPVLRAEIQIKKAEPTRISLSPALSAVINLIARQRRTWQQTESLSTAAQPHRFPPKYRWFTLGGLEILRLWLWICNQPGKKSGFLCSAEFNLPG